MTDYQVRKDIDRIYDDLYRDNDLIVVTYDENGELQELGSLDNVFEYYNLKNVNDRLIELENRVKELEDGSD